jgi:hypothetical protein
MLEFRSAIERRDLDAVVALLARDVVFRSPIVYAAYHGPEQVRALLIAVARVFEDFSYSRQIGGGDGADHAYVFRARVGDREVEGCDFVHTNDEGLIDELYVMVRPLSGAVALAEAMKRELAISDPV